LSVKTPESNVCVDELVSRTVIDTLRHPLTEVDLIARLPKGLP